MKIISKTFDQLTTGELYEIIRSRVEVFVVEQNCPYQEADRADYFSRHLFVQDTDGRVTAYLRMFDKPDQPEVLQIGRVLTVNRMSGDGKELVQEALRIAAEEMGRRQVFAPSQVQAKGFYEKLGFRVCGEEYLEDDIPHVGMLWEAADH